MVYNHMAYAVVAVVTAAIDKSKNERGRFFIWVVVRNKLANLLVLPSADEQSCRQK